MKRFVALATVIAVFILLLFAIWRIAQNHSVSILARMIQNGDESGVARLIADHRELLETDLMLERRMRFSPLAVASALGKSNVCARLIAAGANVNSQDKFGLTPLHKAVQIGDANVIVLLVQHGANLELRDNMGRTPLDIAREMQASESVTALLSPAVRLLK